jgi:hypothetical protein
MDGMRNIENDKEVYSFHFPKEGVFIFNKPTTINFERNVKVSNMTLQEENHPMPETENLPNPFLLCKLFEVSYSINFTS